MEVERIGGGPWKQNCYMVVFGQKVIIIDPGGGAEEILDEVCRRNFQVIAVLNTHGHFDHIADAIAIAQQSNATVIANWEIVEWLNKNGVEKTHPMNTGGKWMFDFGKVKCVSAVHSSSLPDGSYGGTAMGFIIESHEANFYYSGDTALTYDM